MFEHSAEKDPAVGLFKTYWGEDWAEDFTHNFLFSFAVPPPTASAPRWEAPKEAGYQDKAGYYKTAKVQGDATAQSSLYAKAKKAWDL